MTRNATTTPTKAQMVFRVQKEQGGMLLKTDDVTMRHAANVVVVAVCSKYLN